MPDTLGFFIISNILEKRCRNDVEPSKLSRTTVLQLDSREGGGGQGFKNLFGNSLNLRLFLSFISLFK